MQITSAYITKNWLELDFKTLTSYETYISPKDVFLDDTHKQIKALLVVTRLRKEKAKLLLAAASTKEERTKC